MYQIILQLLKIESITLLLESKISNSTKHSYKTYFSLNAALKGYLRS